MLPDTAAVHTSSPSKDRTKFFTAAANGTAIYVLAYGLVWGLHQLAKYGLSRYLNLRGSWDPSRILYSLADGEWWRTAIVAVHGVGPAVTLVLGIVAFRWYWKTERANSGHFKLLLLWVAMHACNLVFGALLSDTFIQTGFWYVPDWILQIGNALNVIVALLAGLVQLGLGYFGAVAFLQAHDSKTVMRYANRQWMVVYTLIVPWVAGGTFIALTRMSFLSLYEGLHLLMMGLLVTPMALGCLNDPFSTTVRGAQPTHVVWGFVVLGVVLSLAWRFALAPPLTFGI